MSKRERLLEEALRAWEHWRRWPEPGYNQKIDSNKTLFQVAVEKTELALEAK